MDDERIFCNSKYRNLYQSIGTNNLVTNFLVTNNLVT